MTVRREPLHTGWTLHLERPDPEHRPAELPPAIPAAVPGCVHTDLLTAGLILDPYLDANELSLDWIGHQQWRYRTTIDWTPTEGDQVDLVCDGLDTVATVLLNGIEVGHFANQHRSYRIPVADTLQAGANVLEVVFDSAWAYARAVEAELGSLPNAYPAPFNFIRKMACNFGWDWGPTVVTAGIWRPIALESWTTARLAHVRPLVTVDGATGKVHVEVDCDGSGDGDRTLTVTLGTASTRTTIPAGDHCAAVELEVPDVRLWWPHDMGAQPLYDLQVELSCDGRLLDSWQRRVGFRTIELDTSTDPTGSAFTVVVNGQPIFVRGANWIPDDCFPSRITRSRLGHRIGQAVEANVNLLRVWGGGLYESDDFYSLCDEKGVLVWQDFLFACAAYPEEDPIRGQVLAEAEDNIVRLMPHASLAMWNGCNENLWGWFDWDWQQPVGDRTWGAGYYLDLLPALVARLDPTRPYYPGSPFSGTMDVHPNDDNHGPRHIWDVWNNADYTTYRQHVPRFVAEFGYQGPANIATISRAIHDTPLRPDSIGMLHHQKATDGNTKLSRGAAPHLPAVEDFDSWHYLMQVNQAEAIKFGIEHFRSHRGTCMGTVLWQLNDCWPVTSWAAIDGDGRPKLLWYALRAAYAPRLLTIQPRQDRLSVVAVNDTEQRWRELVTVQRITIDGAVAGTAELSLTVEPFSTTTTSLPGTVARPTDPSSELLVATTPTGEQALWFFVEDKELLLTDPQLHVAVSAWEGGIDVTITAQKLARHLTVMADRWDSSAVADDASVTLLPGGRRTFRINAPTTADPNLLTSSGAIRTLNDLLVPVQ